ncbi:hypothetical protein DFJ73DRAFT_950510 [Zopfochytrium polystomum]|nr:hypothetical protein DFJ73DRAFT_950510 [Zopfochytrium polystomum]
MVAAAASAGALDWLLPGFILEQRGASMFPDPWHSRLNVLWIAQAAIVLLYELRAGRWVPAWDPSDAASDAYATDAQPPLPPPPPSTSPPSPSPSSSSTSCFPRRPTRRRLPPWPVRQFSLYLLTHSLVYIVELYATSMWSQYRSMFFHHVFALLLFLLISLSPASYLSVSTTLPMLLHGYFWVGGATDYVLLFYYNLSLLTTGAAGLSLSFLCGPCQPAGAAAALACVALSWTNYFAFCYWPWYGGGGSPLCAARSAPAGTDRDADKTYAVVVAWCAAAGAVATVVAAWGVARGVVLPAWYGVGGGRRNRVGKAELDDGDDDDGDVDVDGGEGDDEEAGRRRRRKRPPQSLPMLTRCLLLLLPLRRGLARVRSLLFSRLLFLLLLRRGRAARVRVGWTPLSPLHGGLVGFLLGPWYGDRLAAAAGAGVGLVTRGGDGRASPAASAAPPAKDA